jgi:hypothetical protein
MWSPFDIFQNINTNFTNNIPVNAPQSRAYPPASAKVINNLSLSLVTADDLYEENNRECAVCLDEHVIGSEACKICCGHLFHIQCIRDWFQKQGTCPVCRYELETDNAAYEIERKKNMRKRKMRFRKDELRNKPIRELKVLLDFYDIDYLNCFEKRDLIEKLITSGHIDVLEGVNQIEMTSEEIYSMSSSELMKLSKSFGLRVPHALEKKDIVDCLVSSERIRVIVRSTKKSPSVTVEESKGPDAVWSPKGMTGARSGGMHGHADKSIASDCKAGAGNYHEDISAPSSQSHSHHQTHCEEHKQSNYSGNSGGNLSEEKDPQSPSSSSSPPLDPSCFSTKELIGICKGLKINISGCVERNDIVSKLQHHLREVT